MFSLNATNNGLNFVYFLSQLPPDRTEVYLSKNLQEIQPKFNCDFQGCIKGRKSPNGKGIYGRQYRTRECFWLGKPCKNHQAQGILM